MNGPDFVHQFEVLASGVRPGLHAELEHHGSLGAGTGTTSRRASSRWSSPTSRTCKKVENAGINYGSTAVPDARGRRAVLLRLDGQRRRDGRARTTPTRRRTFIAYLTTTGQKIRYETSGDIPLDLAVADEVNWAGGIPGREDGLEVLSHARPLVFVPNRWDVDRAVLRRVGVRPRRGEDRPGGARRGRAGDPGEPRQGLGGLGKQGSSRSARNASRRPAITARRDDATSDGRGAGMAQRSEGVDGAEGGARRLPLPVAVADRSRGLFWLIPIVASLLLSFSEWDIITRVRTGSGLENYRRCSSTTGRSGCRSG